MRRLPPGPHVVVKTLTTWEESVAKKAPGTSFRGGKPELPETGKYLARPIVPAAGAATKIVVMEAGDSLSSIAMAEYGSYDRWPLLYHPNKDGIGANPNLVSRGFPLAVAPLTSYTPDQIKSAKPRAPSWKKF